MLKGYWSRDTSSWTCDPSLFLLYDPYVIKFIFISYNYGYNKDLKLLTILNIYRTICLGLSPNSFYYVSIAVDFRSDAIHFVYWCRREQNALRRVPIESVPQADASQGAQDRGTCRGGRTPRWYNRSKQDQNLSMIYLSFLVVYVSISFFSSPLFVFFYFSSSYLSVIYSLYFSLSGS